MSDIDIVKCMFEKGVIKCRLSNVGGIEKSLII